MTAKRKQNMCVRANFTVLLRAMYSTFEQRCKSYIYIPTYTYIVDFIIATYDLMFCMHMIEDVVQTH